MKKRYVSLFLSVLMLLSCFVVTGVAADDSIVRIGVFSDSHNVATGINNVMDNIFSLANDDVDGVALVGDIVYFKKDIVDAAVYDTLLANAKVTALLDAGKLSYAMGNHEFPEGSKNEYADEVRALFTEKTGLEPENNVVLGGYHFIAAGAMDYSPGTYTDREPWLRAQIEAALAEDENKPVFVSLHHPVPDTFYRTAAEYDYSAGVYSDDFVTYLKSQPRVIVFSGHLHHPGSDPKTIWQQENGATFIQTARVSGGNNASDPYATKEGDVHDSSAIMLEIDKNTNVVTVKRFHVSSSGGTYFDYEWRLDIPAMAAGADGAYQFTDDRYDTSKAPVFSESSTITTSSVTESSATLTFPTALAGDDSENSLVEYYRIKVYDMDAALFQSEEIIMSDYYKPTQAETISHTLFELSANTTYKAEIIAESAFYKKSKPISVTFSTTAPEFPAASYLEDTLTKSIDKAGTEVTATTVPENTGARYDNFWAISANQYVTFTFSVPTPGVYRISSQLSSTGTNGKLTIAGDTANAITKEVNTGAFAGFKEKLWVDYAFADAGDYTITLTNLASTSLCVKSFTIGKIANLSAGDIGYNIEKNVLEREDGVYLGAPYANASALSSGKNGYITWSLTPEYSGMYSIIVNFNASKPTTCYLYQSDYSSRSDENLLGSATVSTGYGANNEVTFAKIPMLAGETYQFTFYNPSTNTEASPYVKYLLATWEENIDISQTQISMKKLWSEKADTNITTSWAGMDNGKYITFNVNVPVDANYEVAVSCGVHQGLDMTVSVGSQSLGRYLEKTADNNANNLAWNTKKDFVFGTVALKAGSYEVKVSTANGGTTLFYSLALKSVGEYDLITDEITVSALDYTGNIPNSHIGKSAIGLPQKNYYADYTIDVSAGNYDLSIFYGNYRSANATTGGDSAATVTVDGVKIGTYPLEYVGGYVAAKATKKLTALRLTEGKHTIRFTWDGSGSTWYSLGSFTLSAIEAPYLSLYRGITAEASNLTDVLTEGSMTARALIPANLAEEDVTMIFAIYEGDALYAAKTTKITAKKNSAIAVTLDDISFTDGKNYTSKVFFWNSLGAIKPYYPVMGELQNN